MVKKKCVSAALLVEPTSMANGTYSKKYSKKKITKLSKKKSKRIHGIRLNESCI